MYQEGYVATNGGILSAVDKMSCVWLQHAGEGVNKAAVMTLLMLFITMILVSKNHPLLKSHTCSKMGIWCQMEADGVWLKYWFGIFVLCDVSYQWLHWFKAYWLQSEYVTKPINWFTFWICAQPDTYGNKLITIQYCKPLTEKVC